MLACVQAIEVAKEKEAEKEKLLEQLKAKVEVGIDQLRASVDRCVALEEALRDLLGGGDDFWGVWGGVGGCGWDWF